MCALQASSSMVAIYVRVSTTEQAEEGYSIEEQEVKLRTYCSAMGYNVHKVYKDPGCSGSSLERPGVQELIGDIVTGAIDLVLVWKLDRISRSQKDMMTLLEDVFIANGCNFVSLIESFDTSTSFGRAIVGILAAFAQLERENIKERTAMGRHARAKKGYTIGSREPLGYKFAHGRSSELVIDQYTETMIKEVFDLFLDGLSIKAISDHMTKKYGAKNQYTWDNNTAVRRLLSNPLYAGKVRHCDEVFDGNHKPIVSEEDFNTVAAALERNKQLDKRDYAFKAGNYTADNLLTGLLFCGDCKARMYARKVSKITKKYICHSVARTSKAMIKSDNCTNRLHPYTVDQLDDIVIDEIRHLALDKSYFKSLVSKPVIRDNPFAVYEDRLKELNAQKEKLLDLYQNGIVTMVEISSRLSSLKEESSHLSSIINGQKKASCSVSPEVAWENIVSFDAAISKGSSKDVHGIIHTLIDKIVVLNEDVTIYWSFC